MGLKWKNIAKKQWNQSFTSLMEDQFLGPVFVCKNFYKHFILPFESNKFPFFRNFTHCDRVMIFVSVNNVKAIYECCK